MLRAILLLLGATVCGSDLALAQTSLPGHAADLYAKAIAEGRFPETFQSLSAQVAATSDNESFYVVWKTVTTPKKWIVSIHGAGQPAKGFATDDLALWSPHLKDREVGIICLQWWMGTGDATKDFYTPEQIYQEIVLALQKQGVKPGSVMFHGFSRGAANTYAVAAIDSGKGKKYFSLNVASSGGVSLDYGPTITILNGGYGSNPLKGTQWVTAAGATDPEPDRDGITGMRITAEWLVAQGAVVVLAIEDPMSGHGALLLNPTNARMLLDRFLN